MSSIFIICYPRGDRTKLAVAEISEGMEYERDEYALASRHNYPSYDEASKRARELAKSNGLNYIPAAFSSGDHDYLD